MSDVENLKQEISDTKAALSSKMDALETQARDLLSPAHQIEKHPFLYLGLSLGAGLLVGSQIKDRKKLLEPLAMGILGAVAKEVSKKYLPE